MRRFSLCRDGEDHEDRKWKDAAGGCDELPFITLIITITILQRVSDANGEKYALVNTSSLGEKAPEAYAKLHAADGEELMRYCVGVVNPGENYVSFEEGRWIDWRDAIDSFATNGDCAYMAYDNLPIKGYVYPLEQVKQAHDLDVWIPSAGGIVAICPECGYVLESCD